MSESPISLNDLREKLTQLKQLAGREMDYGSNSDAIQNAYILATEALHIMGSTVAGGVANSLGGLDTTGLTKKTSNSLLPCPGCGNKGEVTFIEEDDDVASGYYPKCTYCCAEIEGLYTKEGATSAWNTRVPVCSEIRIDDVQHYRQELHDAVVSGLRHYFSDHPESMTRADIGSATKRIMGKVEKVALPKRELSWLPIETAPKDGTEVLVFAPKQIDNSEYSSEVTDINVCCWDKDVMMTINGQRHEGLWVAGYADNSGGEYNASPMFLFPYSLDAFTEHTSNRRWGNKMSFDMEPEYELTKEDHEAWEKRVFKEALEKIALLDSVGNPLGCQSHLECIHTAQEALGMNSDIPELGMQVHIKASSA